MNKKLIAPFLALGIITGSGVGLTVLASETDTTASTQTTQTQVQTTENETTEGRRGVPGGRKGHHGGGMDWGFAQSDTELTIDQQKELNLLRAEYLNARLDFQAEHETLSESLKTAIESGTRDEILTAWDAVSAQDAKIQEAVAPVLTKIQAITGTEDAGTDPRMSSLTEKIEALKSAATDEEIQTAIEALQTRGHGDGERPGLTKGGREMKSTGTTGDDKTETSDSAEDPDSATSASPQGNGD